MTSAPATLASLCSDPDVSLATSKPSPSSAAGAIVSAGIKRKPGFLAVRPRFQISEYLNPRTHSVSYRVTGSKHTGERVRENFADPAAAQLRQMELESEWLGGKRESVLQHTTLSADQLRLAEAAFLKLGPDWLHLPDAVSFWQQRDKPLSDSVVPALDGAIKDFTAWLDSKDCELRSHTRGGLKNRVKAFGAGVENRPVNGFRSEDIELYLARYGTGAVNRDNQRRAVSRFFSWCMERPRRWVTVNPCAGVSVAGLRREKPPEILSVEQCAALLRAAEAFNEGELVPYVAIGLFAGLRPFELARLERRQVNLADGEIRIEDWQSKIGGRVVDINATLRRWLRKYPGAVFPKNWRKLFAAVRQRAGITHWPVDVLRHTAISHHFRRHTSYGLAAEQFGNSERIIKKDYQGRVTAKETKRFYGLKPLATDAHR